MSTSASTPIGTSQITISASTSGEPAKTQTLSLTVGTAPDYALAVANPSLNTSVNSSAIFNGTLTAVSGYNSVVAPACGCSAPPNCIASPASAVPGSSGTPFTVTVSSSVSQAYSFNITGVGSDPTAIAHSAPVNFTALPSQSFDFTIAATPANVSVPAGQAALYSLDVAPTTAVFPNNVSLSCSKLPALTTCNFNPAQISSGSGESLLTLTLSTTKPIFRRSEARICDDFSGFLAHRFVLGDPAQVAFTARPDSR